MAHNLNMEKLPLNLIKPRKELNARIRPYGGRSPLERRLDRNLKKSIGKMCLTEEELETFLQR